MAGRKVFTREVLSSADVQGYLMDQEVPRFPSSAVRATQWAAPPANALSMLDTAPGRVDYWHPTAGPAGAGIWLPLNYGAVRGKMWRTVGGSASLAVGADTVCSMGASRVGGGVTFASDALTLPLDGRYDLDVNFYLTNAATGNCGVWIRRIRSSVANNVIGQKMAYKFSSTIDTQDTFRVPDIPLKAGDQLALTFYSYVAGIAFFGTSEPGAGCSLAATYVGPLNGATPF